MDLKKQKGVNKMMNKIKNNPTYAAVFYFLLTWAGFPLAVLVRSSLRGISFGEAACSPYLIAVFAAGSIISAMQMYSRAKFSK